MRETRFKRCGRLNLYAEHLRRSCKPLGGVLSAVAPMPRKDFPERDDKNWMKHTLSWLDTATGEVRLGYLPVHSYTLSSDVEYIQPKKRVY